jgi:hypothetical protein
LDLKLNFETFHVDHRPPPGKHAGVPRSEYLGSRFRMASPWVSWQGRNTNNT